jgi:DNA (cytosine-5)-methyltransferase 1
VVVPAKILSLCTGLGGLDLGVEIALRNARVVCAIERDAYCAAVLAQSMEQGHISQAPIWDDLRTFNGRCWRGTVDIVTAGYPCQPFSVAGKHRGAEDPRHLWPEVARIVRECAAPIVFLENVARHLTVGFDVVARDLQGMGYTVAATVCRAATVGAPHQRERLFALAVSDTGRELCWQFPKWDQGRAVEREHAESRDVGSKLGNANGLVGNKGCELWQSQGCGSHEPGEAMANGNGNGSQVEREPLSSGERCSSRHELDGCGGEAVADTHGEQCLPGARNQRPGRRFESSDCGFWPPGPNELDRWATVPAELQPNVESALCRVVDGLSNGLGFRREQLHALGNAVVPLQAAYAFVTLVRSITEGE